MENPPAVISAIDDVIQGRGIFEPQLARHPASLTPASGEDHTSNDEFRYTLRSSDVTTAIAST